MEIEIQCSNEARLKEEQDGEDRRRGTRDDLGTVSDPLPHPTQSISHAFALAAHSTLLGKWG